MDLPSKVFQRRVSADSEVAAEYLYLSEPRISLRTPAAYVIIIQSAHTDIFNAVFEGACLSTHSSSAATSLPGLLHHHPLTLIHLSKRNMRTLIQFFVPSPPLFPRLSPSVIQPALSRDNALFTSYIAFHPPTFYLGLFWPFHALPEPTVYPSSQRAAAIGVTTRPQILVFFFFSCSF